MTTENQPTRSSPAEDSASGAGHDADTEAAPEPETSRFPDTRKAGPVPVAAASQPARRIDLDWEREPGTEIDPEDSRGGRADNLARLLDDVPPHHVDH
jgi:hypothetical protein